MKVKQFYLRYLIIAVCIILGFGTLSILFKKVRADADKRNITIQYFENLDPVYTVVVEPGTEINDLGLPSTLRGVIGLSDEEKGLEFVPAEPQIDELGDYDYYSYGYIALKEENIYAIVYENADNAFRVYGSLAGAENAWYSCDKNGVLEGWVIEVAVSWENTGYEKDLEGSYTFTASVKDYIYSESRPFAIISVEHTEETEHNHLEDEANITFEEEVSLYEPNSIMPAGTNLYGGDGANDIAMNNFMEDNSPTKNLDGYTSEWTGNLFIPKEWVDYVNTIWADRGINKFEWTSDVDTGLGASWKWTGTAAQLTGDPTVAANIRPIKSGNIWPVYSANQFQYAMEQIAAGSGTTIELMKDLDFNGYNKNWVPISLKLKDFILKGNGKTIYNIGIFKSNTMSSKAAFVIDFASITVTDLNIVTSKIVSYNVQAGFFISELGTNSVVSYSDYNLDRSMVYGTGPKTGNGSIISPLQFTRTNAPNSKVTLTRCSVTNGFMYGIDHVAGFSQGLGSGNSVAGVNITQNSYSANNLICGTGGHSSGFSSCMGFNYDIINCFAANEVYGSVAVSGFRGGLPGATTNCFATGKLEGYAILGGFSWSANHSDRRVFTNCYSTTLVGLRTRDEDASRNGGLAGFNVSQEGGYSFDRTFIDCYAAGEVGNYDTDMNNPLNVGGFLDNTNYNLKTILQNCYYDKQTTAMREWAAGNSKTVTGVTGLLTDTNTKKGYQEIGMASGQDFGLGTTNWTYVDEHYPQLKSMTDSTASLWGSEDKYQTVLAYSVASTSTIFLNSWDTGYTWDEYGVRSAEKEEYNGAGSEHKAGIYTYDTVREIITDFTTTTNASFSQMIEGGAKTSINGVLLEGDSAFNIDSPTGKVTNPGMDWYRINVESNGTWGYRPIRLISYMALVAGEDKTGVNSIRPGQLYDHRLDVKLTMMSTLSENLVVGRHDDEIWATALSGGYPDSNRFWAVPTTALVSDFTASEGAWLYTEIWRVAKNSDGSYQLNPVTGEYITDRSIQVTGQGTGNNTTLDELKWNGVVPLYMDSFSGQKYLVTYFWQLKDGRYRTDSKEIDILPGEYDVTVDVYNSSDGSPNSTALSLDTKADSGADTNYQVNGENPSQHSELLDQVFGTNVTTAWEIKQRATTIDKLEITFTGNNEQQNRVFGSATVTGPITVGSKIEVDLDYYYPKVILATNGMQEVTTLAKVRVTYEVKQDEKGGYYLQFNKLVNQPSTETPQVGDDTGLALTDGSAFPEELYINNLEYNIAIKLYVTEGEGFTFIKENEKGSQNQNGDPMDGVEFHIYTCTHQGEAGHVHSEIADNSEGNCWEVTTPYDSAVSGENGIPGQVAFEALPAGEYMLVEVKTLPGYELPQGQWLIRVAAGTNELTIEARGEMPPAFKKETIDGGGFVYRLPNYKAFVFPPTGGNGTLLFTVLGIILLGGAVILVIYAGGSKKKVRKQTTDVDSQ